eukprot:jgi/Pico_ML_1/55254/g977.t1
MASTLASAPGGGAFLAFMLSMYSCKACKKSSRSTGASTHPSSAQHAQEATSDQVSTPSPWLPSLSSSLDAPKCSHRL